MASSSTSGGHDFDSIIPLASASSSGRKHMPYDVFINYCGQDVKRTLASRIYYSLDSTGLQVFLDKEELQLGDSFPKALEEAIRSASIHIAIFSENYAQSPWCLAELAFMLESGATIIPIFYHVEPPSLRWGVGGKGIYADAFSMYERKGRYSLEQVERWKQALQKASFYAGPIVRNQDDEQTVVKNVVNRVIKEMSKVVQLEVAKHPVGLDEAVQDFETIALQSAGSIQIVGIWGMGGSGKTTLAKKIFNKRCLAMDRSSFLFDMRDAAGKGLLVEKQKKLLEDLDVKDVSFDNVDAGKEILESCLRSLSVLIILDDVDHTDQLDALLPARETLGHGSLIVVTTRELDVLKAWDISAIYQMRSLNATHAKQLFCWNAFLRPSPLPGFEDLVENFLIASNHLPLSLKVIGAQLYGKSEDYWQSLLDKLSRILPDDIKLRLKVSYDALDDEEKEMFLDTACFFIGQRKSVAIAVWGASKWNGLLGWETLFNKCLVEVDEDGFITMHDHLRNLGREIANRQSPYRLWSPQQSIQIHPQQEAIRIRGMANAIGDNCYPRQGKIIIHTSQGEHSLALRSLGLKIFVGNGDFLSQEHSELSRELVWLQCNQFEHKNLPSWLSLKKLRILELFNSRSLEDLWERDADAPLQLRELVIDSSNLRGFPRSIGHLKNLKKILIGQDHVNCDALSSLPQEFCHLQSLEHLEIKWCRNLSSLPSDLGELRNLQHLNLNGCTKLKMLPYSFKMLTLLEYLNLEGCSELIIKSELNVLENMTKLRHLNLDGCKKLEELRLPEVASLTELYLKGCSLKELPANIFQLTRLTDLVIGSEFLTTLPTSLGNLSSLTRLGIQGCKELECLPDSLGHLSSLTRLGIQGCKELEFLPDSLEHLNFLRDLDIKQSGVKLLPKSFIHLQSLNIDDTPISELSFGSGCMLKSINLHHTKVSKISISGDSCPFLETLSLVSNKNLWYLETLPATLKRIVVIDCNFLKHIKGVGGLKNLKTLEIKDCGELEGLPSLAELVSLEIFILQGSSRVKKIAGLQKLRSLRELRIELIELPSLAELTSLKKIELQNCHNLEKIESLKHLKSLDELKISDRLGLKALPSLKEITSLKEFQLITCHKLEKIEGLENLKSLETLRIYDCPELDGLPCLTELTSLKKLYLQMYDKLEKVEGLERLRSLETLKISDCPELDGLPSLAELTSLKEFDLRMCHKLKKIEGLEQLRSLEKLEVHTRWKAPCIVSLEQCQRLKSLVVVANDRSAIEPFIRNRQKWPREVITCTRAVFDVGSLKNYFELPNVYVLDFDMLQTGPFGFLELRRPESSANANAILICLIIDCNNPDLNFYVRPGIDDLFDPDYFNTELGKGKWVWMGVFTQGSEWLLSNLGIGFLCVSSEDKVNAKVEQAWLVMGEEGSMVKAFHPLFQSDKQRAVKEMNKVPLEIANHPVGLDEALEGFDIKQRLKTSYDELDEEEKQMFLDTACFFIGEENSLAIAVWDGSEWSGLRSWESLFNKHLVYLDENNRITMHDHLRDLGREIADQQSPYRLRSSWQLNQIQPQQEHIKIRGMINATGADCYSLQGKILIDRNEVSRSPMSSSLGLKLLVGSGELSRELLWLRSRRLKLLGLKLLVGSGEFRYQEIGELSRELLWLRWDDFNHTNLPPWLSLKNLRVLELNGALNLQELWTDDAHAPLQLRELIITGTWSASFERFPSSISYLNHLRKIALLGDVGKEFGIKGLPEEFCDLQSLEHLELRHCTLLSSLPARFGDLRNLRRLDLCSCKGLRMLPVSFQQLTHLKYLDLSGCKRLVLQKDILENITQLENLYLSGCLALQELPHQITDQASMKELRLQHTSLQDLPSDIGQLCKLQVLTIGSPLLKSLPDSFGDLSSLKSLSIIDCFALESLPKTLGHLELLEHLCLEATGVRSLPEGFRQLANLRTLKISDCPLSELDFGSVSSFSLEKLTEINLSETLVTRISISQHCCPRLKTLRLTKNDYLEEIETLPATVNNIELSGCETLKNIKGSHAFPILPKLAMSDCPEELEKPAEF